MLYDFFSFVYLVMLGIEPQDLCMLSKPYTTWAMPLVLINFSNENMVVGYTLSNTVNIIFLIKISINLSYIENK
jgi:hypothetical protein